MSNVLRTQAQEKSLSRLKRNIRRRIAACAKSHEYWTYIGSEARIIAHILYVNNATWKDAGYSVEDKADSGAVHLEKI